MSATRPPATLVRTRRVIFGIVLASFVLSFFHRTAPAAIASELTRAFAISGTVLGTLAATYFYVYTVLQVPVGVLADTLGPRRLLAAGSVVAGLGSLLFALAPTWEIAAAGRTLVGIGVSVAFIAILKITAVWFPANRFATLNGVTMLAGNLGAVIAGAPLAWVVGWASWRAVFVGLAALSLALGVATWIIVRDRPEECGFAAVNPMPDAGRRAPALDAGAARGPRQRRDLARLLRQPRRSAAASSPGPACGRCRSCRTSTRCRASPRRSTRACSCSASRWARCSSA